MGRYREIQPLGQPLDQGNHKRTVSVRGRSVVRMQNHINAFTPDGSRTSEDVLRDMVKEIRNPDNETPSPSRKEPLKSRRNRYR